MIYDLIIIGMGPAGVSAAIYAKRAGLNILCLDKAMIGGYLNYIDRVDNYPGLFGVSGPDFAFKLYEHIKELDIEFKNENVVSVINDDVKIVKTNSNEYLCKNIIIATGRKARELGLENESKLKGKGISNCALCDGAFYKEKIVAVVGGGNSAIQEAIHLASIAKKVYVVHRRDSFKADAILVEKLKSKTNVELVMNSNILKLITENDRLSGIVLDSKKEISVDGLFTYIGFVPSTEFALKLDITDENGYIIVNSNFETDENGIYAVGDIIKKDIYQVSTAVADGVVAAVKVTEKCK